MATESSITKSWLGMNIPKLNATNYRIWKELMNEVLEAKELMEYVDEQIPERKPNDEGYKEWKKNNATALATIKGALILSQLNHVVNIKDAKTVWDKLKSIYQIDNDARVQALLVEFIQFHVTTTIDEGASRLSHIQQEISNMDKNSKPNDKMKTQTLLCGLGPKYDFMRIALNTAISPFEVVVAKLRNAELRITHRNDDVKDQETARIAENNHNGQQKKKKSKKGVCYQYGKPEHFKRECKAPQGGNSSENSRQNT
jgi:hypothetical protein